MHIRIIITSLALGIVCPRAADAALILLRQQSTATTAVIRLGDVAEIRGADPATMQRLESVAIQPAPDSGRHVRVRVQDIKSRLQALGENLTHLEFRGSSIVEVSGPPVERTTRSPRFSNRQQNQLERRVSDAIQKYLETVNNTVRVAAVAVPNDPEIVRALLTSNVAYWKISGGQAPWNGKQQFQVHTHRQAENHVVELTALLEPKPRMLVLRHPVAAGHVISRDDLAWKPVSSLPRRRAILNDPRSLIGRESSRNLPEGRPLSEKDVKRSLLVKRGDTVTVYSRAGAVTIKTVARARDEGGYGEQIALQTLDTNRTIVARVVDFHIAEITPDLSKPQQGQRGFKVRYAPAGRGSGPRSEAGTTLTSRTSTRLPRQR